MERICGDHEKLVEIILEEEEELIGSHRTHIDDVVDLVKQVFSKNLKICNYTFFAKFVLARI